MSRATSLTPLLTPLAQSQFPYTSVGIVLKIHLICTYVMTARCRHDTVARSWRQFKASVAYFRPLARTANSASGYGPVATAALWCASGFTPQEANRR
jgi:hypothetical protein